MSKNKSKYIRWFKGTTIDDVLLVGGKNASLGERIQRAYFKRDQNSNGFTIKDLN